MLELLIIAVGFIIWEIIKVIRVRKYCPQCHCTKPKEMFRDRSSFLNNSLCQQCEDMNSAARKELEKEHGFEEEDEDNDEDENDNKKYNWPF